jgi:hypothetical protein
MRRIYGLEYHDAYVIEAGRVPNKSWYIKVGDPNTGGYLKLTIKIITTTKFFEFILSQNNLLCYFFFFH